MKIRVNDWYGDGHENDRIIEIDEPNFEGIEDPEDYLEMEFLQQHTGDGHGLGKPDLAWCCEVTILEAQDQALVGREFEYGL